MALTDNRVHLVGPERVDDGFGLLRRGLLPSRPRRLVHRLFPFSRSEAIT
jgi:hypothetical protein